MVFLIVDMTLLSITLWYIFLPRIWSVPRQYLNENKIPVPDFFYHKYRFTRSLKWLDHFLDSDLAKIFFLIQTDEDRVQEAH